MSRELKCLRCGREMDFIEQKKLPLGQQHFLLGDCSNLIIGAQAVDIYGCHKCGKLEFFMPDFPEEEYDEPDTDDVGLPPEVGQEIVGVSMDGIPQVRCPACGRKHDFDYPHCPYCKH